MFNQFKSQNEVNRSCGYKATVGVQLNTRFAEGIETWSRSSAQTPRVSRFGCAWLAGADVLWWLHQLLQGETSLTSLGGCHSAALKDSQSNSSKLTRHPS